MERARLAAAVVSAVVVAARTGLVRRRAAAPSLPSGAGAAAPVSAAVETPPPVPPAAEAMEAAGTVRRGGVPRLVVGFDRWLGGAGVVGLLATLGLVARNVFGWPAARPAGGGTDWALVSALLTLSVWVVYLFWKVPEWQAASRVGESGVGPRELFEIENAARGTLGQILSGLAVLAGLLFAWQQLGNTSETLVVSQEGQITERFTRAVDQLGSDDISVRLGGIYALERIGRDSARDRGPVLEVLAAFVRQNAPLGDAAGGAVATPAAPGGRVGVDVQAVLMVLTAPGGERREGGGCLDLGQTRLVGADLAGADLAGVCLDGTDLSSADLRGAFGQTQMVGARLSGTDLTEARIGGTLLTNASLMGAGLIEADLTGADLTGADLRSAVVDRTSLRDAKLNGADLTGALLSDADLTGVSGLTRAQRESATILGRTTLPGVAVGTPGTDTER